MGIRTLEEPDRKTVFHASTHLKDHASGASGARIIERGSGIRIVDANGREFIAAFAGLYGVNVGYGRKEIAQAMRQGDILGFAPPLNITRDEVDEVVARTRRAVDLVTEALERDKIWHAA